MVNSKYMIHYVTRNRDVVNEGRITIYEFNTDPDNFVNNPVLVLPFVYSSNQPINIPLPEPKPSPTPSTRLFKPTNPTKTEDYMSSTNLHNIPVTGYPENVEFGFTEDGNDGFWILTPTDQTSPFKTYTITPIHVTIGDPNVKFSRAILNLSRSNLGVSGTLDAILQCEDPALLGAGKGQSLKKFVRYLVNTWR